MDYVLLFKIVQGIALGVFAVFISDFRRKKHMVPFARRGSVIILKLVYLVPLTIYASCLLGLSQLRIWDAFALLFSSLGTFTVVKAKVDLGRHHTWTGYRLEDTQIVTHGIYSYVRHPLYVGIFVFIAGGVCTGLPRVSWGAVMAGFLTLCYIAAFLTIAARREAKHLDVTVIV